MGSTGANMITKNIGSKLSATTNREYQLRQDWNMCTGTSGYHKCLEKSGGWTRPSLGGERKHSPHLSDSPSNDWEPGRDGSVYTITKGFSDHVLPGLPDDHGYSEDDFGTEGDTPIGEEIHYTLVVHVNKGLCGLVLETVLYVDLDVLGFFIMNNR